MNKERILYAISIMEQAKNLYMNSWQTTLKPTTTTNIKELHTCGNSACFAGYLALSPLFQSLGGEVGTLGQPVYGDQQEELAVLTFFEMDERYLPLIEATVFGQLDDLRVGLEEFEQDDLTLAEASDAERKVIQQITDITGGVSWEDWEPKHVIRVLTDLLDGEFDWLLEDPVSKPIYVFKHVCDHILPSGTHLEVREGEDMVCGAPDPNWTVWLVVYRGEHRKELRLSGSWGHSFTPAEVIEDAVPRLSEVGLNLVTHTSWILRSW